MRSFLKDSWFKIVVILLIITSMYLHFSNSFSIPSEPIQATSTLSIATTIATTTQNISTEKKIEVRELTYKTQNSETKSVAVEVPKPVAQVVTPQAYISNVMNSLLGYQTYSSVITEQIQNTEEMYKPLFDLDYPYGNRFKTAVDDLVSIRSGMYRAMSNIGYDVNNFRVWINKFDNGQDIDQLNTVQKMAMETHNTYSKEMKSLVLSYSEVMARIDKNREEASKYLDEKIKERAKRALSCTYLDMGYGITKVYCE